jgi:hypothetical protein
MGPRPNPDEREALTARRARTAPREELLPYVHSGSEDVLLALLENPHLDEKHLILLLERKDLPGHLLGEVGKKKAWLESYPVKLRLARHPRTPRVLSLRLVKQLYLFDLANLSLLPQVPAEIRRLAEEMVLSRLLQLPLGQKYTLARRGSGRVAAALLAEGASGVVPLALDNAFLTESQVLKLLAQPDLPEQVVAALASHPKWSCLYNVRMALVRHPLTPLARVLSFLPDLTLRDLAELVHARTLSPTLREYIRGEVEIRSRRRPRPPADSKAAS